MDGSARSDLRLHGRVSAAQDLKPRGDVMDNKDAHCWVCDRPVNEPGDLEVFPTSKIAFHLGCLSPRSDVSDAPGDPDRAPGYRLSA
jgi:hypothetical protein